MKVGRYAATCVCGVKTSHSPNKRWFECPVCGYRAPRDVHAARNMIRFGTPVERGEAPVEANSSEHLLRKQEIDRTERSERSSAQT